MLQEQVAVEVEEEMFLLAKVLVDLVAEVLEVALQMELREELI
jgi:hypothetical protein